MKEVLFSPCNHTNMNTSPTAPLEFNPPNVFTGDPFTVSCRANGTDVPGEVSWELNGTALTARNNPLTVSPLFSQSTSFYKCTYAESSQVTGVLTVKPRPQLNLKPLSRTVGCEADVVSMVKLECCVQSPYEVQLNDTTLTVQETIQLGDIQCKRYTYSRTCANGEVQLTCQETTYTRFKRDLTLTFSTAVFLCEDEDYGGGLLGVVATTGCQPDETGNITAQCQEDGTWLPLQDNCVLFVLNNLLQEAENLDASTFPAFVDALSNATVNNTDRVSNSSANIHTIVSIFTRLANVSRNLTINKSLMTDILDTANVLVDDRSTAAWNTLNNPNYTGTNNLSSAPEVIQTMSDSSAFLASIEAISISLSDDPDLNIFTERITLNRSRFSGSFSANLSMVSLELPGPHRDNSFITTINFNSLDNVLLPSNASGANTSNVINGNVLLVLSNSSVDNVTFTFDILNPNLTSPQCVFWNFSLLDNEGAWDGTGCTAGVSDAQIVTCNCNHLTSFSILMSPFSPQSEILDYITYIGVGISLLSLVICLIIEAIIWRKINRNSTSYLRHTCIVNIAVSLLIANIWFIIGAFVSDSGSVNPPACFAVTFFIHFFYLSLFFWMLMSGLLLLYRTISVFGGGLSDGGMVAVGFSVGYGAPLLIAVVTIAVTAPNNVFFRPMGVCWLNWYESMALLAFVIPALLIVVINLVILAVVLYKMLRSQSMGNSDRSTLMVIVRSLAVLTPFFGTTWGLGVGTMTNPEVFGIHVTFALFNSLQGFFILVFGTLLDVKVRSALKAYTSTGTTGTQSTSAGPSTSGGLGFLRNLGRRGYNINSAAPVSTSGEAASYSS
ncbi:adhesion G-protein coupled receptor F1-like [Gadus morhua]|uniref:adhesion G-protein coupled receptor F1-like n=1 Tax=Gadus morhua TaxID=8049 RepID=UPI0011B462F1|nr:adhesion G-protein coupled receptor F1-like [Gadus morhua]